MSDHIPNNIAETILAQASKEAESRTETCEAHDGTEVQVLVARQGITATVIQDKLDFFADIPRSRAGRVRALDLDSFAALVMRDYDAGSVVMIDVSGAGAVFEAVLDYHHPIRHELAERAERTGQRRGCEIVLYEPALSEEWEAWTAQSGKGMSQGEFAGWIDEHLPDLADPRHLKDANMAETTAVKFGMIYGFKADQLFGYADPERMVKLSTGFSVREKATIKSVVNLSSGEVQAQYETTHDGGADDKPLDVPRRFLLSIPVFKREAAYLVPVKLAYRKKGSSIEWYFELYRPDRFRDDAIEGTRTGLAAKLTPKDAAGPVVPIHLAKRG